MTDIVQKLRRVDPNQVLLAPPPYYNSYLQVGLLCHEAATEIERLRGALKRYGQHRNDCAVTLGGYQCTCGFNQQEQPR